MVHSPAGIDDSHYFLAFSYGRYDKTPGLLARNCIISFLSHNVQVISPVHGVEEERFIVWMRTAALPTFRKLYGRIEHNLAAPTNVTFSITASEKHSPSKPCASL